jgi:translation initiation factor 1 (eIF-1/SUI1)
VTDVPKLSRWLVASRQVEVIDRQTLRKILDLGGNIGGGWSQVHQHIGVNGDNKEKIEELLQKQGFTVTPADESPAMHPENWRAPE